MKKAFTFFLFVLICSFINAQTHPTPQPIPFAEDFTQLTHNTTDWPAGIQGWRINNQAPGTSFQTAPAQQDRGLEPHGTAASTGNNVYNFDQKIGFRSTTGGNNMLALALNTAGYENITIQYDMMTIRNLAALDEDHVISEVGLQYRIGTTGDFTNIPGTHYQNPAEGVQTEGTQGQAIENFVVELPDAVNNQDIVQLRWLMRDISGLLISDNNNSRPSFAIDNISVSGDALTFSTFYYSGSGSLADVNNWGSNPDGSGTVPADFASDDQLFIIANTETAVLQEDWSVTGAHSRIAVGNGNDPITFVVDHSLLATVDVNDQALLELRHNSQPTLGVLESGSSVKFSHDADAIPYHTYYHLILEDINPVFNGSGAIEIAGNLTLLGTVQMPDAREADEYDIIYNGSGNQMISGNGNVVRGYDIMILKESGSLELSSQNGGTIFSSDSQLTFALGSEASFFDHGNTLYAGNSVNIGGHADAYHFTGTLILADEEEGIVKGAGANNNFNIREGENENAVAALNHLVVRVPWDDVQFRFRSGSTNIFTIKGDFIVEAAVEGRIRFYDNEVQMGGNLIIEEGFAGQVDEVVQLTFLGDQDQIFEAYAGEWHTETLWVEKPHGYLLLHTPLTLSQALHLEEGIIQTHSQAGLYMKSGALVQQASANGFVEGPIFAEVDHDQPVTLQFPIGEDGIYRPVTLTLTQENEDPVWYSAQMFNEPAPEWELDDDLASVSSVRHYLISQSSEVSFSEAAIELYYGEDDQVANPGELRIAKAHENSWINLGGTGNAPVNGTITSTQAFFQPGIFALAEASGEPAPTVFYARPTGSLHLLSNWSSNPDGTGTEPDNFSDNGLTFNIYNNTDATIDHDWEVSGLNSVVNLGDGTTITTFTVPSTAAFTGSIHVSDEAHLVLHNSVIPNIIHAGQESSVTFTQDAQQIPYLSYYHLILEDIDPVFNGSGAIEIAGNLTLLGTVQMPDAREADEYDMIYNGSGNQMISGNGNVVRGYDVMILKESGSLELSSQNGGTIFSSDSQLTFALGSEASFFDHGNTLYAGNSVNIGGHADAYHFTGTLILADEEEGIVKGAGANNNFNIREGENENAVAAFNHIVVRVPWDDVQFRFRSGSTNIFTIKGDFIVEAAVEGRLRFYDNEVQMGGNLIIEEGFAGQVDEVVQLTFLGDQDQVFEAFTGEWHTETLWVEKPQGHLILHTPLTLSQALHLEEGIIQTHTHAGLYMKSGALVQQASANGFVEGTLFAEVDHNQPATLQFPIGEDGIYRPVTLSLTQENEDPVWYSVQMFTAMLPELDLPDELEQIYDSYYYHLSAEDHAVMIQGSISIPYDADHINEEMLRVAKSEGNSWQSLGGNTDNGTITSTENFTTGGYFALAEQKTGAAAHKLQIVSVNNGASVYANEPFSLHVQALDEDNYPAEVFADILFEIVLESGTGELSGTLTGIIPEGSTSATMENILYNVAESGVSLRAEAEGLEAGLSEPFEVLLRTYELALATNIAGAGQINGSGYYPQGDEVTIEATANQGFEFISWYLEDEVFATEPVHSFQMPAHDLTLTAHFEMIMPHELELIHYWHFNSMDGSEVTEVLTDYSVPGLSGMITYPGEGDGYMDARTHRPQDPVSNFNLRLGEEPDQGAVLRLRNPAHTRQLLFEAPSTGYENLWVTYAATRTENGATHQNLEYSLDEGETWETALEMVEIPFIGEGENAGNYAHVSADLSQVTVLNNHPGLIFRIMAVGEGADNPSGNQRIDNFTIDGTPITGLTPESLTFASVNEGNPVFAGEAFSLHVVALDHEGLPAETTEDIEVSIDLHTGTGSLSGTLNGVIAQGSSSVIFSDIFYDTPESGVKLSAQAEGITEAISDEFEVLLRTYQLSLLVNMAGAGEVSGEGNYPHAEEVTIEAIANQGYGFMFWSLDGEEFSTDPAHTFEMPAHDLTLTAHFEMTIPHELELIHYWHFNTMDGSEVTEVATDFSAPGLSGMITYPGEGGGYMDARTHRPQDPVSNFNLRLGEEPDQGAVLRVRNPAHTRQLLLEAPSTGFKDLLVTFATTRSENGGAYQRFEFSADGGATWIQPEEDYAVPFLEDDAGIYLHKVIDLSGYGQVNNNPQLQFRVLSVGEGSDNPSGNQRFDNFTLDGVPDDEVGISQSDINQRISVYPNPAHTQVQVTLPESGMQVFVYNTNGMLVMQQQTLQNTTTLDITGFSPGIYIIRAIDTATFSPLSIKLVVQ